MISGLPLADRAAGLIGSPIDSSTSLLARQSHDIVRFAMGSPADEMVPTALIASLAGEIFRPGDASPLQYAASEGDPGLRSALLALLHGLGENADPDRLLITSGGMQGLDLACKLFVDAGDLVAVESPTYTNGIATALSYGGQVLEVPVDGDGMVVEALPELAAKAGRPPAVIYVIPNFQNPSGVTMSEARRRMLLDLAARWNSVVIDDDPYGMLRFSGSDVPGLQALSGNDPRVVSVRTFSKIIAPGLRVGWVLADPRLVTTMVAAKQAMDTCTNHPAQRIVAELLNGGHLDRHLDRSRTEYRSRKQAMDASLRRWLGDIASWTDPEGGFFVWVTLPEDVDAERLFEVALAAGVAFIPGPAFSASGGLRNAIRLCFASNGPERTDEGVFRLCSAIASVRGRTAQHAPAGNHK